MAKQSIQRKRGWRFTFFRLANIIQGLEFFPRRFRPWMLNLAGLEIASVRIQPNVTFLAGEIVIREGSYINTGVLIDATAPVSIGRNVFIGPRANIITASHEIGPESMRAAGHAPRSISIGDGVWIGTAALILPGVNIGAGCIIAAGAVVARSTADHGLYAGVPAKRVRDLPVGEAPTAKTGTN